MNEKTFVLNMKRRGEGKGQEGKGKGKGKEDERKEKREKRHINYQKQNELLHVQGRFTLS